MITSKNSHSFISFNRYFFRASLMPGTLIATGDTAVQRQGECPHRRFILGRRDNEPTWRTLDNSSSVKQWEEQRLEEPLWYKVARDQNVSKDPRKTRGHQKLQASGHVQDGSKQGLCMEHTSWSKESRKNSVARETWTRQDVKGDRV